jgi:hypothetical protein
MKEPLALASAEHYLIALRKMVAEEFPIPEALLITELTGGPSQVQAERFSKHAVQERRAPWSGSLL